LDDSPISRRKSDHLAIARDGDVAFHVTGTLLDEVGLVHEALPDLALEQVDTSVELFGKRLRAPLVVAAMTGGSDASRQVNLELARAAQERGCAMGLGSQRAMLLRPELVDSYRVRDVAPDILLLGNLGIVQARDTPTAEIEAMLEAVGADALCVHMNPAMELVQAEGEGDRDFRGGLGTFRRLVGELKRPVIAKETGCGISYATARRLRVGGVLHADVSGAGGTSWVAVEAQREPGARPLGLLLREWGIPTAASVAMARRAGLRTVIATGGIQTGLDVARAVALGADAAGLARPVLQALGAGGPRAAIELLARVEHELRVVMMLVGARSIAELRRAPTVLGPRLGAWLELCEREPAGA
jgi:isopentenyl-diphosphate delta-isomerase